MRSRRQGGRIDVRIGPVVGRVVGVSGDGWCWRTLWEPPSDIRRNSCVGHFIEWAETRFDRRFENYDQLWQWSVRDALVFWGALAEYFQIAFHDAPSEVLAGSGIADARWFPGGTLNYAEELLSRMDEGAQIVTLSDTRGRIELSRNELRGQVEALAHALRERGIGRGDRVAGYLPDILEAIVAFLAAASIGAIWSLIPPEFGSWAAVARLQQFRPDVLFTVDGYRYGEKTFDRRRVVAEISDGLKTLKLVVSVPYLSQEIPEGTTPWSVMIGAPHDPDYAYVPFEHPLYVLYSSGTTGRPRPSCTVTAEW